MKLLRRQLFRFVYYYSLVNLPLALLLGIAYIKAGTWPTTLLGNLYTLLTLIGQMGWLCILPTLLVTCLVTLLIPRKSITIPVAVFIMTLTLLGLCLDNVVFQLYRSHINGVLIAMIFSKASRQIFEFSLLEWTIATISVLFILALEILLAYFIYKKCYIKKYKKTTTFTSGLIILSLLCSHLIYAWADAVYYSPVLLASENLPIYYGLTARRFLARHGWIDPSSMLNKRNSFTNHNKSQAFYYPKHPLISNRKAPQYNVLIIGVDTLRADMLNAKIMPNTYKFAQQSIVFNKHFSGGNATYSGIFSLFYALPANYFNITYLLRRAPVLFDVLKQQKYNIHIDMSASSFSPPFYANVFSNIPKLRMNTPGNTQWQRDQWVTQDMIHYLTNKKQQHFFGFIFYDSVHAYNFPANFKTPFTPWRTVNHLKLITSSKDKIAYFNKYKNSVYYVDSLIGKLLRAIKKIGLEKNTIIIITADHGEEFDDNKQNYWGHNGNFSATQTQVPMIVFWPNKGSHIIHYQTSHYDIAPTLLRDALGISNPPADYSIGGNLFKANHRKFLLIGSYARMGVVTSNCIININRGGIYQITNLHAAPLPSRSPNMQILTAAFKQMHLFNHP